MIFVCRPVSTHSKKQPTHIDLSSLAVPNWFHLFFVCCVPVFKFVARAHTFAEDKIPLNEFDGKPTAEHATSAADRKANASSGSADLVSSTSGIGTTNANSNSEPSTTGVEQSNGISNADAKDSADTAAVKKDARLVTPRIAEWWEDDRHGLVFLDVDTQTQKAH